MTADLLAKAIAVAFILSLAIAWWVQAWRTDQRIKRRLGLPDTHLRHRPF